MYALTSNAMKYMDEYTMSAGISSSVLMENAARGLAEEIEKRFPERDTRILFVCGAGNNGGDGVAAARWLLHKGYSAVKIYFYGDVSRSSSEFSRQLGIIAKAYPRLEIARLRGGDERAILQSKYDVVVDGLFGIGLNRVLDDETSRFVSYLNSKGGFKLAIDIPSGINASSGLIMSAAFKADLTVSFGNYKTGMFFGAGREYCGEVVVKDIGLLEGGYDNITDKLTVCDTDYYHRKVHRELLPREETGHKGTFGTVGIAVSSNGMLGASMLAAKAAYRTGCGLVKIFCPTKYVGFFNVSVPEAVAFPYKSDDMIGAFESFVKDVDTILIGPGLKEDNSGKLLLKQVLAGTTPAVIDAGALNIISENIKHFKKRRCKCVITPHVGEMAKLCGTDINSIARNRIAYTRKFSEQFNVSMVVKSDVSLISLIKDDDSQRLFINTVGNSGLATAGSGDVLAGVIASLIAQGNSLNKSLLFGVMIHGGAAESFATDSDSKRKMMAGDIIDNLF